MQGTSPRTRGKLLRGRPLVCPVWNIPAHAGKTYSNPSPSRTTAEHPRARGENRFDCEQLAALWGTSPRTRGKPPPTLLHAGPLGNIPAHAGKTRCRRARRCPSREHPRARGENGLIEPPETTPIGTSPRTRGKRVGFPQFFRVQRNIPAHAGKTHPRRV